MLYYRDLNVNDGVVVSLKGRTLPSTRLMIGSFTILAEDLLKQSQATTEGTLICDIPPRQGKCH